MKDEMNNGWVCGDHVLRRHRSRGLHGNTNAESAGYDPPFPLESLRRNEILLRLDEAKDRNVEG